MIRFSLTRVKLRDARTRRPDSALLPTVHACAIVVAPRSDVTGFGVRFALELLSGSTCAIPERGA